MDAFDVSASCVGASPLRWTADLSQKAVLQLQDFIDAVDDRAVVGSRNDRHVFIIDQGPEEAEDRSRCVGIKLARRLIREDESRSWRNRSRIGEYPAHCWRGNCGYYGFEGIDGERSCLNRLQPSLILTAAQSFRAARRRAGFRLVSPVSRGYFGPIPFRVQRG